MLAPPRKGPVTSGDAEAATGVPDTRCCEKAHTRGPGVTLLSTTCYTSARDSRKSAFSPTTLTGSLLPTTLNPKAPTNFLKCN